MSKAVAKTRKKGSWYYRMTLSQKRGLWGLVFLSPWLFGFLAFFLRPFVNTIRYAFSDVDVTLGEVEMAFVGIDNFRRAFTVDVAFNQIMLTLAFPALAMVAVVVIFSLLAAILINGKYPGRSVVRTIFFIPIIMGANIAAAAMVGEDQITLALGSGIGFGGFSGDFFLETLQATGIPMELANFVNNAIDEIFDVLARAGVPVLIFLAGLQSVPSSLYEVAKIEGCTAYETFWKVTLPMVSPMVLLSTVYSIIHMFASHSTIVAGQEVALFSVRNILNATQSTYRIAFLGFQQNDFGLASAMVLVYIVVCLLVIALVTYFMSKVVFYYD